MTVSLNAIEVKHERRIRLIFSRALSGGAFGAPAPAYYIITCLDSAGTSPTVSAAMIVTADSSVVELALGSDLVKGSLYSVSAIGVPATDSSVTPNPSLLDFRWGINAPTRDVEPIQQNRDELLYGVDLLWNGLDYQETASGDLDRIGGTSNVNKAIRRGLEAQGLTWDQSYGARLRDFVDSPSTVAGTVKGNVQSQVLRDPRVKNVKVSISTDNADTYLLIEPKLASGDAIGPVSIVVPNG